MSESNPPRSSSSASASKSKAFKPRANITRKTKAEREAHAKQEAERAAARAAVAAQAVGKTPQAGKSAVSKKRDQVRDSRDDSQGASGGVFGSGTGSKPGWAKKVVDGGRSEMLEGQEGVKPADALKLLREGTTITKQRLQTGESTAPDGGSGKTRVPKRGEDGIAMESEDETDERNRDIERIWISSNEDEDADWVAESDKGKARASMTGRKPRSNGGLRPVRAPRTLAEEQDAEAERGGSQKMIRSSKAVIDDADEGDDGDGVEAADGPTPAQLRTKQDMPSSPETFRRSKTTKRSVSRVKDARIATETVEERAERVRLNEDIEKLKYEFAFSPKPKKDEDIGLDQRSTRRDSKMFLFQFPPLIPFLNDSSAVASTSAGGKEVKGTAPAVKQDPDGPPGPEITEDAAATTSIPGLPRPQMEGSFTASEPLRLPPGCIGKLRIHKSGKVSLDWGGTDMEVRYGTEVDFLQDAVLVETPAAIEETEETSSSSQIGATYTLGHVQKKMIVIPDWQKLYD